MTEIPVIIEARSLLREALDALLLRNSCGDLVPGGLCTQCNQMSVHGGAQPCRCHCHRAIAALDMSGEPERSWRRWRLALSPSSSAIFFRWVVYARELIERSICRMHYSRR
jgi:hypothetical protein